MAAMNDVYGSAGHFNHTNFEVQRTNHFEIVLDLDRLNLGREAGKDGSEYQDVKEHIRLSTRDVSTPKVTAEAITIKHGNDTVKVASAPSFDDLSITVYDTIGRDQVAVIQAWFDKVFNYRTKLMGLVQDYKTDGTLYMYSPNCELVRAWRLQGVWPRSFGAGNSFSFDQSDVQTITLDLSVDRYYEETLPPKR